MNNILHFKIVLIFSIVISVFAVNNINIRYHLFHDTDGQVFIVEKRCVEVNEIINKYYIKETFNQKTNKTIKIEYFNRNNKYYSNAFNSPIITYHYYKDSIVEKYLNEKGTYFYADATLGFNKIVYILKDNKIINEEYYLNDNKSDEQFINNLTIESLYYAGCEGDTGSVNYHKKHF